MLPLNKIYGHAIMETFRDQFESDFYDYLFKLNDVEAILDDFVLSYIGGGEL